MLKVLSKWWVVILLPLSVACVDPRAPGQRAPSTTAQDCLTGNIREGSTCREVCLIDGQCPTGQACADGLCVAAAAEADTDAEAEAEAGAEAETETQPALDHGPAAQAVVTPLVAEASSDRFILRGAFVEAAGVSVGARHRLTNAIE